MENEEKNLIGKIIFKKYIIKKLLGIGTLSEVYLGQSIINNKSYAIKSENIFVNRKQSLKDEAFILYNLKGFGIPDILTFGRSGNYRFLVQTLLGKSLKDIWIEKKKKLCLRDICLIAKQTLDRIEFIHSKNYIHRDIKPENFLLGNPDNSIIYLIDFGNARKYRSSKTGKHIQSLKNKRIFGTALFLSINASRGYEQSRRDDLESLGYMYIYLAKGELPWNRFQFSNKEMLIYNIFKLKQNMLIEDLCKDLPNEFCDYMKYVRKLNFESKPDYDYLRSLFKNILYRINIFSWMGNYSLTLDIYKENSSIKNYHFLKKKSSERRKILTDLNYFNSIDIENMEENKNKRNKTYNYQTERQYSISFEDIKKPKETKNISNNNFNSINIFNNNYITNLDTHKKIVFPKFKEYIPRFATNHNNNIIKKQIIGNNNSKNNYNIINNTNKYMNNSYNKFRLNKVVNKNINNYSTIQLKFNNNEKYNKINYLNTKVNISSNLFNKIDFSKKIDNLTKKNDLLEKSKLNIINMKSKVINNINKINEIKDKKKFMTISNKQADSFGKYN